MRAQCKSVLGFGLLVFNIGLNKLGILKNSEYAFTTKKLQFKSYMRVHFHTKS